VRLSRLRELNPEALKNIVGRLLEAKARSMWEPSDPLAGQRLAQLYEDIDDEMEMGL